MDGGYEAVMNTGDARRDKVGNFVGAGPTEREIKKMQADYLKRKEAENLLDAKWAHVYSGALKQQIYFDQITEATKPPDICNELAGMGATSMIAKLREKKKAAEKLKEEEETKKRNAKALADMELARIAAIAREQNSEEQEAEEERLLMEKYQRRKSMQYDQCDEKDELFAM